MRAKNVSLSDRHKREEDYKIPYHLTYLQILLKYQIFLTYSVVLSKVF